MGLKIYVKIRFGHFFICFGSLLWCVYQFIYLMFFEGFKSTYQKRFNQKIYLGKSLEITVVYFCYGHASLKWERIFHWIAIFATTKTTFMSVNKKQS